MGDIHKSVIQNTNTISFEHELCSVLISHNKGSFSFIFQICNYEKSMIFFVRFLS